MKKLCVVLFVSLWLVGCGGAPTLPKEAEAAALSVAQNHAQWGFNVRYLDLSGKLVTKDQQFEGFKAIKGKVLESAPAQLSENEKRDGLSEAWCLKIEFVTTADKYTFTNRYALLAVKKFNDWLVSKELEWNKPEDIGLARKLSRCEMSVP